MVFDPLFRIQRGLHLLAPPRILRRYHQRPKAVALAFNPYAFRVVNQQIDVEAGRVLGAAGAGFAVVPLLVHHAIEPNAVQPEQAADASCAAVGGGVHPHFPAALAAEISQLFDSVAQLLVA